jgi:hypothetical protein
MDKDNECTSKPHTIRKLKVQADPLYVRTGFLIFEIVNQQQNKKKIFTIMLPYLNGLNGVIEIQME